MLCSCELWDAEDRREREKSASASHPLSPLRLRRQGWVAAMVKRAQPGTPQPWKQRIAPSHNLFFESHDGHRPPSRGRATPEQFAGAPVRRRAQSAPSGTAPAHVPARPLGPGAGSGRRGAVSEMKHTSERAKVGTRQPAERAEAETSRGRDEERVRRGPPPPSVLHKETPNLSHPHISELMRAGAPSQWLPEV